MCVHGGLKECRRGAGIHGALWQVVRPAWIVSAPISGGAYSPGLWRKLACYAADGCPINRRRYTNGELATHSAGGPLARSSGAGAVYLGTIRPCGIGADSKNTARKTHLRLCLSKLPCLSAALHREKARDSLPVLPAMHVCPSSRRSAAFTAIARAQKIFLTG